MLVDDEDYITGAISGGCLERDALKKAMLVITKQQAKLVKYDASNENDALIGIQLGCEGIIYVLFEPIDPVDRKNPIELIRKALIVSKTTVVVTFLT